jgi:AcrR family transcriptional regulator
MEGRRAPLSFRNQGQVRLSRRRGSSERSEALLQQLEDLFLEVGFVDLTVDALARKLQCSKSTLYAIEPSRDQLVVAVVKHFFRYAAARIEAKVAEIHDPRDRVAVYLAGVGEEMRRMSPACYADMVASGTTRGIYDHNSRVAARRVQEMIREGITCGAFRPLHAEFVGQAVSLLIEGIQQGALLDRTGLSSGDAFVELAELVLSALAIDSGESSDRRSRH